MIQTSLRSAQTVRESSGHLSQAAAPARILSGMRIASRADYLEYLQADLRAARVDRWHIFFRWKHPVLYWQRWLRRAEYHTNCSRTPIGRFYAKILRLKTRNLGMRLGFTIPTNVFGPGLFVPHWGTIVINDSARVGADCRIHPGTCIGEVYGGTPVIGDHAYIGPGAKLYGGIVLGDHVRIGANAVVGRSFPEGHVTLVGSPAHAIQKASPGASSPLE
jgi:serine O-acetyltransferase